MMAQLDMREARYDKFRGAVVVPAGANQVAISHEALESWVNRSLSSDEAVEAAALEKALLARVANSITAHDNAITITAGILNSRSWELAPPDEHD